MKCESERVGNRGSSRRAWRPFVAGLAGAVLLYGLCAALASAADTWFEDWSDGNDVNPPLNWEKSELFPGLYDASGGNYLLTGQDIQDPIGISDNDDEILSAIAGSGDDFISLQAKCLCVLGAGST